MTGNLTRKSLHMSWVVSLVCLGMSPAGTRKTKRAQTVNHSFGTGVRIPTFRYSPSINSSSRFRSALHVLFVDRSRIRFISSFAVSFESPSPSIFGIASVITVRKPSLVGWK